MVGNQIRRFQFRRGYSASGPRGCAWRCGKGRGGFRKDGDVESQEQLMRRGLQRIRGDLAAGQR